MNNLIKLILSTCLISFAFSAYNVGQTVSSSDQNIDFNVCYGDYESSTLSLADFNGALNGGSYKVIHIDMAASW
ncbi:MAG: hypothetical protein HN820_03015 [Candidatus Marinimicrobia bacterium]|jgi:hypothetical protein|nr:hypothetical protein [Candidatus Neomarinimicrobiota bacterium]MBT5956547.1 hypothetical protein [Candidatus Neomarinimicrobiota bacterium]MBT6871583.1 hypothetical protein [Candidatus Neomarinimicrobiota bacterium]MBT7377108.1 hypothetical protein [Candidatus Neomarinimicrobiota bacterium]|tara:strand:+ start:791 stop:1012 length:222 start_codon:yes stop_codon:yes gene_type:complete